MSLKQLIKACKKNNLKAQSQLYHMYKDDLFMLCLKYCRNTEEAEDNLQDAFMTIFKNIKKYNWRGSFEGWMKRITINKAIDKYKKKGHLLIEINNDLLTEDTTIDTNNLSIPLDKILNHIQELPNKYRLVFNLYEMDGYSHKDIAELLSISESASKSNLHRAKHLLKKKIKSTNSGSSNYMERYGN